jgi:FixJ family two-component response regulator/FtsZ-binding cell division protein ZapB
MKKLFVAETDKDFQTLVKSLCPADQVEVRSFSSGMEIFPLIAKEKPCLVLVSLDLPDLNDFVMYDLLKKTDDNSIPIVVTYSNQSDTDLQQYKKMKFQPKDYCQKPLSNHDIHRLLKKHLELDEEELDEEDDDEFSDENIDRLVRGEYLKTDAKDKDDTKELLGDTENDFTGEAAQAEADELEIADILETPEKRASSADTDLRNQAISLERQDELLRSENKELSRAIETLKAEMAKGQAKIRLLESEFRKKEEQLIQENRELKEEKEKDESSLQNEVENLKQLYYQLKNESSDFKKREESLNRTVSRLVEEKVSLSEKVKSLEEKENTHLSALENLNQELEKVLDRLHFYKTRVNELGGLLQQALALTQKENLE